jgi:anti-anti-sigma regulatory factor
MMYKSLENKERFRITGINDNVREILETTGFDQILGTSELCGANATRKV